MIYRNGAQGSGSLVLLLMGQCLNLPRVQCSGLQQNLGNAVSELVPGMQRAGFRVTRAHLGNYSSDLGWGGGAQGNIRPLEPGRWENRVGQWQQGTYNAGQIKTWVPGSGAQGRDSSRGNKDSALKPGTQWVLRNVWASLSFY